MQDEEEVFLQEILTELRGGTQKGGMETKNIKEMFQLTLEWLRNIREDHHDLTKKIDEMKKALNKDIDKNEVNILDHRSSSDGVGDSDGRPTGSSKQVRIRIMQSLKSISEEDIEPNERTLTKKKSSRRLNLDK